MARNKFKLIGIPLVVLAILVIFVAIVGNHSTVKQDNKKQSKQSATNQPAAKPVTKPNIIVSSTGYTHQEDGKFRYGFVINNKEQFAGTISITFSGASGTLNHGLEFTENNLVANAGDIGSIALSGHYSDFTYQVKTSLGTFDYPKQPITNNL